MKKQNEIYEKLKDFQDKDLIQIISINSKDYLEETIIIAKEILQSRGFNNLDDNLIEIKKDIIKKRIKKTTHL